MNGAVVLFFAIALKPNVLKRFLAGMAFVAFVVAWHSLSNAQGLTTQKTAVKSPAAEQGVRWAELKPSQQAALKPIEHEWAGIGSSSKQKWLELSVKFPKMTPEEQARVQERMTAWANLTSHERGEARVRFQEAKQVPSQDRQARWKAYEALSPDQKQQLAEQGLPMSDALRRGGGQSARGNKVAREVGVQAKSNIVPTPSLAASPRAIAPTVVQARLGATTTLVTKRAVPPIHQQPGLPKIAATPEFVNKATLLPRRGPQGAATRSVVASAPDTASRQ